MAHKEEKCIFVLETEKFKIKTTAASVLTDGTPSYMLEGKLALSGVFFQAH